MQSYNYSREGHNGQRRVILCWFGQMNGVISLAFCTGHVFWMLSMSKAGCFCSVSSCYYCMVVSVNLYE